MEKNCGQLNPKFFMYIRGGCYSIAENDFSRPTFFSLDVCSGPACLNRMNELGAISFLGKERFACTIVTKQAGFFLCVIEPHGYLSPCIPLEL